MPIDVDNFSPEKEPRGGDRKKKLPPPPNTPLGVVINERVHVHTLMGIMASSVHENSLGPPRVHYYYYYYVTFFFLFFLHDGYNNNNNNKRLVVVCSTRVE